MNRVKSLEDSIQKEINKNDQQEKNFTQNEGNIN
jgi:hypothetical protein